MEAFQHLRGSKTPPPLAEVALNKPSALQSPREDYSTSLSSAGSSSPTSPNFDFYPVRTVDNNLGAATSGAPGGLPHEQAVSMPNMPQQPHLEHPSSSTIAPAPSVLPLVVGQPPMSVAVADTVGHPHHPGMSAPVPVLSAQETAPAPAPAQGQQPPPHQQDDPSIPQDAPTDQQTAKAAPVPAKRRQKRLERNRESARLSRRRRKQYLEVLEENVYKLSDQVDSGRRLHVSLALPTIQTKRSQVLAAASASSSTVAANAAASRALRQELSRTSLELKFVTSFQSQQLKSLALPPSSKFVIWLSLQNEPFFRGGRASSERLSAARIGERMLSSGTDQVAPSQNMWPLFCNEVGLSYEQEERVRNYQRLLLQTGESWLHRHTAFGADKTMNSLHDAIQAVTHNVGQREAGTQSVLSDEQRVKLAAWAAQNRDRLQATTSVVAPAVEQQQQHQHQHYQVRPGQQHAAADLYTLNHQLSSILQHVQRAPPVVSDDQLKKLSRRPLFESMGSGGGANPANKSLEKEGGANGGLSREDSFASTGSLKRSMNEMSVDDDRAQTTVPPVIPSDAQVAALPLIEQALGHVKAIIPASPTPAPGPGIAGYHQLQIPAPTPVSSMMVADGGTLTYHQSTGGGVPTQVTSTTSPVFLNHHPAAVAAAPAAPVVAAAPPPAPKHQAVDQYPGAPQPKHARHNSFLPPHLNVVPEEMWPADTDDFLMNLMDEDWAIGGGLETENMPS